MHKLKSAAKVPALVEHDPRSAPPDRRGQYDTVPASIFVT